MNVTGRDLRNIRKIADYGVLEMANKIGVSKKTFQNWENEVGAPKINQFIKMCAACGICTASFLIIKDTDTDPLKCVEVARQQKIR